MMMMMMVGRTGAMFGVGGVSIVEGLQLVLGVVVGEEVDAEGRQRRGGCDEPAVHAPVQRD